MYGNGYCQGLCMSIDGIGGIDDIDGVCPMWTWTGAEDADGVGGGGGCGGGSEVEEGRSSMWRTRRGGLSMVAPPVLIALFQTVKWLESRT